MNLVLARPSSRTYRDNQRSYLSTANRIRTNIFESAENFVVQLAIPGYRKEELSVNIEDDKLVIVAKVNRDQEPNSKFNLQEFDVQNFKKIYSLGDAIDRSSIEAKHNNGLLEIKLNKKRNVQKEIVVS